MKSELITLTDSTEGFCNIVVARGPGTGIMRMTVTLRNQASIDQYGPRVREQVFSGAVSLADLTAQAQAYLDEASDASRFQEISVRVSGEDVPQFHVGQKVRVSDPQLGFTTVAPVQEVEWTPGAATLHLGQPPVNLLDLINRDRDEERKEQSLGLPVPVGLRASGVPRGIEVYVNPYLQSRAVGVDIHASTEKGFTPDVSTQKIKAAGTTFIINALSPGVRYYLKARAYDERGDVSGWTEEVSAVPEENIGVGEVDMGNFAPGLRPPRVVSELPVLPDPAYQVGDLVALIMPDGTSKLYEAIDTDDDGEADTWLAVIRADAIEGQLTAQQLADRIIDGQKVAPGLQIPLILDEVPFTRPNDIKFGIFTYDGVNSIYSTFEGVRILEELLETTFWCVHWFGSMGVSIAETKAVFDRINEHGRVPFFSFQNGGAYDNASIIAGTHDAYLTQMAEMIRDTGKAAYIRIFPEMNGSWAPWYPRDAGPQQVVNAWRKVVDVFRAAGANNVKWVWNPNVTDDNWDSSLTPPGVNPNWDYKMEDYYPGDDYVDFTGFDTYNRGTRPLNTPSPNFTWLTARGIFDRAYQRQLAIAPSKKMIMGEFGSEEPSSADVAAGRSKEQWVDGLFSDVTVENYPAIEALVYFDQDKSNPAQAPDNRTGDYDWTIRSSPGSIAAFRRGLAVHGDTGDYESGSIGYVTSDRQLYEYEEGYWWRAVESSILKANSVVAGTVAAGAIGTRELRANSVTAEQIAVADLTNLARNGEFTLGSQGWRGENPGRDRVVRIGSRTIAYALEVDVISGWPNNVFLEGGVECEQGTRFTISFWARRVNANAALDFRLNFRNEDGNPIYPGAVVATVPTSVVNNTWVRYHATVTAEHPTEWIAEASLQVSVAANASPLGSWQISNVLWRRSVGGELIVDGAVTAEKIAAKAITVDKLMIGDTTNMIKNPEFWQTGESGPVASLWGWELEPSEGVWQAVLNTASSRPSPAYVHFGLTTYWRHMWTEWEPAVPDAPYYLSVVAQRVGAVNILKFGIQYETATGAIVSLDARAGGTGDIVTFAGNISESIWVPRNGITFRVPHDARRVRAVLSVEGRAGTSGHWRVAKVEMRRSGAGELLVDGSISADHLLTNSVTSAKILAGAVISDKIAAQAITADKMRSNVFQASWNNLLLNGGAENGFTPGLAYPKPLDADPNDYNDAGGSYSRGTGRLGGRCFRYSYVNKADASTAFVYFNGFSAAENILGVPVAAGDKIHFSGWFRLSTGSTAGRTVRMRIYWRNETGGYLDEHVLTVPTPDTTWRQTIHNVTVPTGAVYAFFAVTFTGPNGACTYEFDDMQARVAYSHVDIADLGESVTVQPDGVYVRKPDTALMLKLGDVTGMGGVPPPPVGETRRYGLWGRLGTGVFIEGVPVVAAVLQEYIQANAVISAPNANTVAGLNSGSISYPGEFFPDVIVPPGMRAVAQFSQEYASIYHRVASPPASAYGTAMITDLRVTPQLQVNGSWVNDFMVVPGDRITGGRITVSGYIRTFAATPSTGAYQISIGGSMIVWLAPPTYLG